LADSSSISILLSAADRHIEEDVLQGNENLFARRKLEIHPHLVKDTTLEFRARSCVDRFHLTGFPTRAFGEICFPQFLDLGFRLFTRKLSRFLDFGSCEKWGTRFLRSSSGLPQRFEISTFASGGFFEWNMNRGRVIPQRIEKWVPIAALVCLQFPSSFSF
jgi:hypothetical protein